MLRSAPSLKGIEGGWRRVARRRVSDHKSCSASTRARRLRRNQTDAERKLWGRLRDRRLLGVKFYRQYSIGPFFVDFFSLEARLVIEVDGSQHAEDVGDQSRTEFLTQLGYRVLRFWNNEVLGNIEGVQEAIADALVEFKRPGGNS